MRTVEAPGYTPDGENDIDNVIDRAEAHAQGIELMDVAPDVARPVVFNQYDKQRMASFAGPVALRSSDLRRSSMGEYFFG